jgi:hypothetical protein
LEESKPAYLAFLLSDKSPSKIEFEGCSLEKLVNHYSGIFIAKSFNDFVDGKDEEILKDSFLALFQEMKLKIDVLIIDWDFLYELWNLGQQNESIRKYLTGIFCLSFMSAKISDCKHCKTHEDNCRNCAILKECRRRKLNVLTIATSINKPKNKPIFPEFLKWLRDRQLETHDMPICTKKTLKSALATIEDRFLPPAFHTAANALASKRLDRDGESFG